MGIRAALVVAWLLSVCGLGYLAIWIKTMLEAK